LVNGYSGQYCAFIVDKIIACILLFKEPRVAIYKRIGHILTGLFVDKKSVEYYRYGY
jgi:hypothetical protein